MNRASAGRWLRAVLGCSLTALLAGCWSPQPFFAVPERSLGAMPLALESQASDAEYGEFVEHARWSHGGVWLVTVHVVGGLNGGRPFEGREARHDEEVARRAEAAVAWLYESFEAAVAADAAAVVVAMHANPLYQPGERERAAYAPLEEALVDLAQHFGKPVLVIHGDEHHYVVDRPFQDPVTRSPVPNLQRLETFGSPDRLGRRRRRSDASRAVSFRAERHAALDVVVV